MQSAIMLPESPDQINALDNLGLKLEMLQEVGLRILTAYSQATPHDAVGAAGTYAYLAAVKSIRDILKKEGWEPLQESNMEMVNHKEQNINILVSSGDRFTGKKEREPSNKNPKGTRTLQIVANNPRPAIPGVLDPTTSRSYFLTRGSPQADSQGKMVS